MQTNVMIVEDEGVIANDIALQLRNAGYSVDYIATSGEEALEHLKHSRPALVLMDIRLRGELDGVDTAIRVHDEYQIPVIFLTAHADRATVARAKRSKPSGYLTKPFRQADLFNAIEIALDSRCSESALIERDAWLWNTLQSSASPTVVVDAHGAVLFLNASAENLLQCKEIELAGSTWTSLMTLVDQEGGVINDSLLMNTDGRELRIFPNGVILRTRDGRDVLVEGEVACAPSGATFARAIVTFRDVSARIKREASLRHEQKMLAVGRLAAGVAHKFNNLLTIITGHLTLMAGESTPEGRAMRSAVVLDAANTATGITENLLTLGGNHARQTEVIEINIRVRHLLNLIAPSRGHNIVKVVNLEPFAGKIRLNTAQIDQLVLNLLMHARAALPSGGLIHISTSHVERSMDGIGSANGHFVRLTVANSGDPMVPELNEHLFEPFFHHNGDGVDDGFGLSVVYGIVKDAGGYISMESKNGNGNVFEVLLPRLEESPPHESLHAENGTRAKTILVVEDDSILRELLRQYLDMQGFTILLAGCGDEALAAAASYAGPIDLLLSDFRMPNMNGLMLSERIILSRPDTKILIMSGYTGECGLFNHASVQLPFIQKPFMPPELLARIYELTGFNMQA
jgi:two-component system cell cycle sensor histidine kinase/response regulator CckA